MTRFSPGFIFGGGVSALDATYHGNWTDNTDGAAVSPNPCFTFTQATHGISTTDSHVYIAVCMGNGLTVTGVTVGGVAAALQVQSSANTRDTSIWSISHAGGNLGNIGIIKTTVGLASRCGIFVITANGGSAASLTATASGNNDTSDPFAYSLNVPAGGIAIGLGGTLNAPGAITWSGISQVLATTAIEGSNSYFGGMSEFATAQVSLSIGADCASGPGAGSSFVVAVFGP